MYTNVNLAAPIGALLFLGTGFLLFVAGLALIYSLTRKKFGLARFALITMAVIIAVYLGVMLIFSLTSEERVLVRGQEKHFCEIDCHLAYSVTDVQHSKTLGQTMTGVGANGPTAAGLFRVVTIKTRFDENTISPTRGNGLLHPNSRVVVVIDDNGNEYLPSPTGQKALETSQAAGSPFTAPLRPGEFYNTTVVFDLPAGITNPVLLIHEGESMTHFVIGHENSPLHKKIGFQI
ncbi:MAG: hypothetical protein AABN95_21075 [Acidobacteriota bacterium]